MSPDERYAVQRTVDAYQVVDTLTGKVVATFDVFNRELAHLDADARNKQRGAPPC